ncbi:MAG: hypothetical protein KKF39_02860 [Nanoarchaeota archaeon]|nr:hypothetical protein [Nanoarchaeota archaeon]
MKGLLTACLIAIVLFCILTLGIVSGLVRQCDDGQTIFKVDKDTNAHGEVWDQDTYAGEICYNEIFEGSYLESDPHQCDTMNAVLRFSDVSNAHAEILDLNTVTYSDVCFGDLDCTQITSGNCSQLDGGPEGGGTDWSRIISLSDITNAHMAFGDYYVNMICCKSSNANSICNYDSVCEPARGESEEYCIDCLSVCGDDVISGLEICDIGLDQAPGGGDDLLNGKDCTSYGDDPSPFVGGNLMCAEGCRGFDVFYCTLPDCGDGEIDGLEDCDPPGLDNNEACDTEEGYEGIKFCRDTCRWGECIAQGACGDGVVDYPPEDCDFDSYGEPIYRSGITDCEGVDDGFLGGNLDCILAEEENECRFNVGECVGGVGFCEDEQPFFYQVTGSYFSPQSCYEYNLVYPDSDDADDREELCARNCVPGASDPVNNGYGGEALDVWGCDWDSSGADGGECYFYFTDIDSCGLCKTELLYAEECSADDAFRTVVINATPIGGSWQCDAGCGPGVACETQVRCPRVIILPFFGAIAFVFGIISISIIYLCWKRKK